LIDTWWILIFLLNVGINILNVLRNTLNTLFLKGAQILDPLILRWSLFSRINTHQFRRCSVFSDLIIIFIKIFSYNSSFRIFSVIIRIFLFWVVFNGFLRFVFIQPFVELFIHIWIKMFFQILNGYFFLLTGLTIFIMIVLIKIILR